MRAVIKFVGLTLDVIVNRNLKTYCEDCLYILESLMDVKSNLAIIPRPSLVLSHNFI